MFKSKLVNTPEMQEIYDTLKTMITPLAVSMGSKATVDDMQAYNNLAVKFNDLVPANMQGSTKVLFKI